jgi:cytochrome c oxidase subunit 2
MNILKRLHHGISRMVATAALFGFSSAVFAAVEKETGLDMPRDVSLDGHRITWLIEITMWFLVVLFILMVVWMAIAIFKHGENHEAEYDHGDAKKQIAIALTISGVIFLIVDGNLYVNAMVDLDEVFWNHAALEDNPNTVKIEINAHQWAWDARYAGPDGKFNTVDDIVTLNDIRIPVDRPVYLQMSSTDVIHSFNLPNFRVKQDVVPGNIAPLWFQAVETGQFDIGCAEHCGAFHYKMKGLLTVLPLDEYQAWATEASKKSAIAYNDKDQEAHWGWDWVLYRATGRKSESEQPAATSVQGGN